MKNSPRLAHFLQRAILKNDFEYFNCLLDHQADVNAIDNKGETRLHVAVAKKDVRFLQHLIKNNAAVNVRDKKGNTPLHFANTIVNVECFQCLIENNADFLQRMSIKNSLQVPSILAEKYKTTKYLNISLTWCSARTLTPWPEKYVFIFPYFYEMPKCLIISYLRNSNSI